MVAKQCAMQTDGGEIVRRRVLLGMRQVDLSEKSGVKAPWLSRIERGEHSGSPLVVKKIADALGCEVADLLSTEDAVA